MKALGRHILVEYYECAEQILNDVPLIEEAMIAAAKEAGATIINSTFHHFSPFGVSGVVVIEESHLAIHTWPEYGYAAVDIFTCGETVDPWIAYRFLEKAFEAGNGSAMEMQRGQMQLLPVTDKTELLEERTSKVPRHDALESNDSKEEKTIRTNRQIWFTERNEDTAMSLRHKGDLLFKGQSPYQKVEVYHTFAYGKLLALDGLIMCTERDEYGYHEMITHVPVIAHGAVRRVLVIGGGDGGTVRELLRHDSIDEVIMVEIDAMVVEAARLHLPTFSSAFNHPKLKLLIEDGIEYVKNSPDESFDLVIVDSTDPVGPAKGLFSHEFYRDVHRILKPEGISVSQSESSYYAPKVQRELYDCFRSIWGNEKVFCYLAFIPTYPSGMWSFSFSSKGSVHPFENFDEAYAKSFATQHELKYYNQEMHRAAFALPSFVRDLLFK